ncbi:MAG: hypothetical protein ACRD6W_15840 [Nitrososphaerales archaeon]
MKRSTIVALLVVVVAIAAGLYIYYEVWSPLAQQTATCPAVSSCGDIYYPGNG